MTPVAVFAFNRPLALQATLEALAANPGAADTDLYVFVDGPRNEKDAPLVARSRALVSEVKGFRSVTPVFSEENKGLAASIIGGVTRVMAEHGTVIVLEDDLLAGAGGGSGGGVVGAAGQEGGGSGAEAEGECLAAAEDDLVKRAHGWDLSLEVL